MGVESREVQDTVAMASTAKELFKFLNLTVGSSASDEAASAGSSSSLVWVILFSMLILASVTLNTVFILSVILSRQCSPTHLLIIAFFLINLLDYALLLFEFSLGPTLRFVYSEGSCSFYQLLIQAAPILTAATFILLIPSTLLRRLLVGVLVALLLSLPSLAFSGLAVYPSGARHCVLDLGGVGAEMGLPTKDLQLPTALYYLVLRALLPFWVPMLLLPVLWKRLKNKAGSSPIISLPLTVAISHVIFLAPLALVLTASCTLQILAGRLPAASHLPSLVHSRRALLSRPPRLLLSSSLQASDSPCAGAESKKFSDYLAILARARGGGEGQDPHHHLDLKLRELAHHGQSEGQVDPTL